MKRILFFILALVLVLFSTGSLAEIPRIVNYQGLLLGADEAPVPEGNYKITFRIYDEANNELWTEIHNQVFVAGGLFQVILGSVEPLQIPFDRPYFLGIQVGEDPELQPRVMMTSAAYSFNTDKVRGISASDIPQPNILFPLGIDGKFPPSVLPSTVTGQYLKKNEPDTSRGTYSDPMLLISNLGNGDGITGRSTNGVGVAGRSQTLNGVTGWTGTSDQAGVFGYSTDGRGVVGRSDSNDGIVGWTGAIDKSGVYGHSVDGYGLTGSSDSNIGVQGFGDIGVKGTTNAVNYGHGVLGWASGTTAIGVTGVGTGTYGTGVEGSGNTWGVYSQGDLGVNGDITVSGSKSGFVVDICLNDEGTSLERGDVVVISRATEPVLGTIPVPMVRKISKAGATEIIGVVDRLYRIHEKPVSDHGTKVVDTSQHKPNGSLVEEITIAPGSYLSVVTLGAYQAIKVDASYGAIHPGDLLTSSPNPGYAMKAQPVNVNGIEFYRPGTIIGRALGSLESGQGTIPVFVSLN
jgi:hypothetical protein